MLTNRIRFVNRKYQIAKRFIQFQTLKGATHTVGFKISIGKFEIRLFTTKNH